MKILCLKPYGQSICCEPGQTPTAHTGALTSDQQATLGKWVTGIVIACAALMFFMSGTTQIN